MAVHEGFLKDDACFTCGVIHGIQFFQGKDKRFFTEHMFACLAGFNGPLCMQMVGERVVNDIHFRVSQQGFVTAVRFWDVVLICIGFGPGAIPAAHRHQFVTFGFLNGFDHCLVNVCRA